MSSAILPIHAVQSAAPSSAGVKPEVARAAREFEAIFLRKVLTSLEKSSHMGGGAPSAGSDVYGSMMVGALADAVAAAGGVGLAKYVTTSLAPSSAGHPPAEPAAVAPKEPLVLPNPQNTSQKGIP